MLIRFYLGLTVLDAIPFHFILYHSFLYVFFLCISFRKMKKQAIDGLIHSRDPRRVSRAPRSIQDNIFLVSIKFISDTPCRFVLMLAASCPARQCSHQSRTLVNLNQYRIK